MNQICIRDYDIYVLGLEELQLEKHFENVSVLKTHEMFGMGDGNLYILDISDKEELFIHAVKTYYNIDDEKFKVFFNTKGIFVPILGGDIIIKKYPLDSGCFFRQFSVYGIVSKNNSKYSIELTQAGKFVYKKLYNLDVSDKVTFETTVACKRFIRECLNETNSYEEMYLVDDEVYVVQN